LDKYGHENPSQVEEFQDKARQTRIENGSQIDPSDLSKRDQYCRLVDIETERNWRKHQDKINPCNLTRSMDLHLDHIFSKHFGFLLEIDPVIIGHFSNLRLITSYENLSKNSDCGKNFDELHEDYHQNLSWRNFLHN